MFHEYSLFVDLYAYFYLPICHRNFLYRFFTNNGYRFILIYTFSLCFTFIFCILYIHVFLLSEKENPPLFIGGS
jgi:hypothetical protein